MALSSRCKLAPQIGGAIRVPGPRIIASSVDTQLPTVNFSLASLAALNDDLLTPSDVGLDGTVADDRQAVAVDMCASPVGAPADEVGCGRYAADPGTDATGAWRATPPILDTGDGTWQTLWVSMAMMLPATARSPAHAHRAYRCRATGGDCDYPLRLAPCSQRRRRFWRAASPTATPSRVWKSE